MNLMQQSSSSSYSMLIGPPDLDGVDEQSLYPLDYRKLKTFVTGVLTVLTIT